MRALTINIRSKLIFVTLIIVSLVFVIQLVFQGFFMEPFYKMQKETQVKNTLKTLEKSIDTKQLADTEYVNNLSIQLKKALGNPVLLFNSKDNIYSSILSAYESSFIVVEHPELDKNVIVPLYNDSETIREYLNSSETVTVTGYYYSDDNEYYPSKIVTDNGDLVFDDTTGDVFFSVVSDDDAIGENILDIDITVEEVGELVEDELTEIPEDTFTGKIVYYQDEETFGKDYYIIQNILIQEAYKFIEKAKYPQKLDFKEGYLEYEAVNPILGTPSLVLLKRIGQDDSSQYIMTILPYESLEEAISIYRNYSWIVLLSSLVVAVILVVILSGPMVKPIKNMERIAKQMANMQFSERIEINSKDEIGQLAGSLNTLALELDIHIGTLHDTNIKLSEEIKEREKQELILKAFLGNASHELKTPVTIMRGLMDGIADGVYDAQSRKIQVSIRDEVQRMEKIIYDLLQVSRMERGAQKLQLSVFDPSDIIYSTYQRHKTYLADKQLQFTFDFEETYIEADAEQIECVVDNLISNAVNYSPKGADIRTRIVEKDGKVVISIENTGIHIKESDLINIYKPFYRVDKSHTRHTGGSGLGLSIVEGILELHHSEYEMINTEEGVEFTFVLDSYGNE